jgi:hypothetical protein
MESSWNQDNYTQNERHYYWYAHTITEDSEFLIEFGDMDHLEQVEWMASRLAFLGKLVAYYISERLGVGTIPLPDPDV